MCALVLVALAPSLIVTARAAGESVGFAPNNIWYSKEEFFDGEEVRIYTVVVNGGSRDLAGAVEFYDNQKLVARTQFSVPPGGRSQEVSTPWTARAGEHEVYAKIANPRVVGEDGRESAIALENTATGVSRRSVAARPNSRSSVPSSGVEKVISEVFSRGVETLTKKGVGSFVTIDKKGPDSQKGETSGGESKPFAASLSFGERVAEAIARADRALEAFGIEKSKVLLNKSKELAANLDRDVSGASGTGARGDSSGMIALGLRTYAFLLSSAAYLLARKWLFYGALLVVGYWVFKRVKGGVFS
ncbi:MAG: hypothetical protein HY536_00950 [Candidatus Colwellbacteria bacterium]|nr:hypothetical protein [Candidatus Colwellbacteria bacterium]